MSLARAFTKRTKRPEVSPPSPNRAQSIRQKGSQAFDRGMISSPVALISTTNMLSYNAPDIATIRHVSNSSAASTSSRSSGDDSDHSASTNASNRSRETLTDASSVESSPITPPSPNHLSCYFQAANPKITSNIPSKNVRRSVSSSNLHRKSNFVETANVPAIPQRAVSHSKRAHEQLARKRSLQHIPGTSPRVSNGSSPRISHQPSTSRSERPSLDGRPSHQSSQSQSSRASLDMFAGAAIEPNHPFGKELEQLNEVAEEFHEAVRDVEIDEDSQIMRKKGLVKLCAADYLMELEPLHASVFHDTRRLAPQMAWI